uniref:Uncharacterized protein n=1 Tax=Fagus sylvatica TaxID=28930 RepID=A0A2N9IHQ0_FAGSY
MGENGEEGGSAVSAHAQKTIFSPSNRFGAGGNYAKALKETPRRLKDRVLTRSLEETDLVEVKGRSQHEMKKTLNWWDLMWFGIGAVIRAGIFVLTGLEAKDHAGPIILGASSEISNWAFNHSILN